MVEVFYVTCKVCKSCDTTFIFIQLNNFIAKVLLYAVFVVMKALMPVYKECVSFFLVSGNQNRTVLYCHMKVIGKFLVCDFPGCTKRNVFLF